MNKQMIIHINPRLAYRIFPRALNMNNDVSLTPMDSSLPLSCSLEAILAASLDVDALGFGLPLLAGRSPANIHI